MLIDTKEQEKLLVFKDRIKKRNCLVKKNFGDWKEIFLGFQTVDKVVKKRSNRD